MRDIGMYLALFGAGSIVLNMMGYEFVILSWIDNWGADMGWLIRGGMIVGGAILFFLGRRGGEEASTA